MKKARILLTLSVWVIILPYLGFPYLWKNILLLITGLFLSYLAYAFYKEYKIEKKETIEKTFDNFSENKDFKETTIETTDDFH